MVHARPGSSSGTVVFAVGMSFMYPALLLLALAGVERRRARVGGRHVLVVLRLLAGRRARSSCGAVVAVTSDRGAFADRRGGDWRSCLRPASCLLQERSRRWRRSRRHGRARVDAVTALLVTNDFPPKLGGIQSYLYELWRRLPPAETTVLTTPSRRRRGLGRAAVVPRRARPERRCCCRRRRSRGDVDALAREVGADVIFLDPMLPLGLIGAAAARRARTS